MGCMFLPMVLRFSIDINPFVMMNLAGWGFCRGSFLSKRWTLLWTGLLIDMESCVWALLC